jgi:DNA-binding response OmpR family regulator
VATILLLEDDETLREVLEDALDEAGYEVVSAASAAEAIQLAESREFDGVISDIRMAGSLDGLDVLARLKQKQPDLPCIVMTGFADELAPLRAATLRVDDYLYKPFEVDELFQSLERARMSVERQAEYRAALAKLLSQTASDDELAGVRSTRQASLNGLFVAVRSGMLDCQQMLGHWDELETLELAYLQLLRRSVPEVGAAEALQEAYQQWMTSLFSRARRPLPSTEKMDPETFKRFFGRVKTGQVGPEDLGLAVCLRTAPAERVQQFPGHQALWAKFWGP